MRRGNWPKALATDTFPDQDGIVRRVRIRTATSFESCASWRRRTRLKCSKVVPAGGIGLVRSRESFIRGH